MTMLVSSCSEIPFLSVDAGRYCAIPFKIPGLSVLKEVEVAGVSTTFFRRLISVEPKEDNVVASLRDLAEG